MSELKTKDISEIVLKLIGPVEPIGRDDVDKERLTNLKRLEQITDILVDTILLLAPYYTAPEYSVRAIGQEALKWAKFWKEELHGELGER